jgi:hypothetical protein
MLPILRILPVGGVLLAIFILVLALNPPDGPHAPLNTTMAPARGALVNVGQHPETRQFLIRAALKRADELNRLRELPDTPTRTEPVASEPAADKPKIAALPGDRNEADPDEPAPAATETPSVRIPVERGEVSAPDLPAAPTEANPATDKTEPPKKAEQAKPAQQDIRRRAHRPRRPKAVAKPPLTLFEALFGQQYQYPPQAYGNQQTAPGQYQQPAYGTQTAQNPYRQPTYSYQQPQPQQQQPQQQQQQQQQQQLQAPTEPYPMFRQHQY